MKERNIILLALGAALAIRMANRRRRLAVGVGRVRRNIFAEIEDLQSRGVTFAGDYHSLTPAQKGRVLALSFNYKGSSRSPYSVEEQYYNRLRRQYLKLVNPAIGRIQYPHTTSVIRNSRGDVVLTYNDYDPEKDLSDALVWYEEGFNGDPYKRTVSAIAKGHKWIWKGKKSGGALLTRGLADELFFSKTNLEGERKLYRALIDNKEGWTIDKFVEQHLADAPGAKDAMLQALRDFPTPKAAKEYILEQYYQSFDDGTPEEPEDYDLPF